MKTIRVSVIVVVLAMLPLAGQVAVAAEHGPATDDPLTTILRRLEALEAQNREFAAQIEELQQRNAALQSPQTASAISTPAAVATPIASATHTSSGAAAIPVAARAPAAPDDVDWASRIRLTGDFRFRHESIDDGASPEDRSRETIRARISAAIKISDSLDGEIGFATGGLEPRGASATLGAASSRKEVGLDLGYIRWRAIEELTLTAGKMRQPFLRPGQSFFFDNELRPEGLAANYENANGLFASAFDFWLEERPEDADSMLLGAQAGWQHLADGLRLRIGAGYYDYGSVQGHSPDFANGLVNEFGNSIAGSGDSAVYLYDYDIGQLFADATFEVARVPVQLFVDYAHNFAADNGLDTAHSLGFVVGRANAPGRWEGGVLTQVVEKDALFGQWIDSDFGGGLTDNAGQLYRLSWMPMKSLVMNVSYYDTRYNVDVGGETDYDRWQVDFNMTF